MGKRTKLREAQRLAAEQALAARLQLHVRVRRQRKSRDANCVASFAQFPLVFRTSIEAYRSRVLRTPENWPCAIKDRSTQQRFLNLVRFSFARFPVPLHLERAWLEISAEAGFRSADGRPDFRLCYIIATQGGSVYRDCPHLALSRREVHHFLNAPNAIAQSRRAVWYAIARNATDDEKLAIRISQASLEACADLQREAIRFFVRNPICVTEMNELVAYFAAERAADARYMLNGRTLGSLRMRVLEWRTHGARAITRRRQWRGSPLPDAQIMFNGAIWQFTQLKSGAQLYDEARDMHHCVHTYVDVCAQGVCAIWSVTVSQDGLLQRVATLELRDHVIVQCRGFANGMPSLQAWSAVDVWARRHGLMWAAPVPRQ